MEIEIVFKRGKLPRVEVDTDDDEYNGVLLPALGFLALCILIIFACGFLLWPVGQLIYTLGILA